MLSLGSTLELHVEGQEKFTKQTKGGFLGCEIIIKTYLG